MTNLDAFKKQMADLEEMRAAERLIFTATNYAWHCQCVKCQQWQVIRFGQVSVQTGDYICEFCNKPLTMVELRRMMQRGEWREIKAE